mmetsp:Transcript_16790/g.38895  ORF Transcript_16790/g.38895 Transcript_16790/m.38895 type:complete len:618 (+) Transcript_16790:168-2021(+)
MPPDFVRQNSFEAEDEDLQKLFVQLISKNSDQLSVADFERVCNEDNALDLSDVEIRRVFGLVAREGSRQLSVEDFLAGFKHVTLFGTIVRELLANYPLSPAEVAKANRFVVPEDYDYTKETYKNYVARKDIVETEPKYNEDDHGPLHGRLADMRRDLDYSWHTNYSEERTLWQDHIVLRCSRRLQTQHHPWLIFTCGTVVAGKASVMRWLSQQHVFPLENVVRLNPDYFKAVMPEFKGYDPTKAGKMCHRESGLLQQLALEVALRAHKNVWIDGSLQDHEWHKQQFKEVRRRFPRYRLALIHVHCSDELACARAKELEAKKFADEHELKASAQRSEKAVEELEEHADFIVKIKNDHQPEMEYCLDKSHSLRPLQQMFQLHHSEQDPHFPGGLRTRVVECGEKCYTQLELSEEVLDLTRTSLSFLPLGRACTGELLDVLREKLSAKDLEDLKLVLSPAAELTLDEHSRKIAGIPKGAVCFVHCHGACSGTDRDLSIETLDKIPESCRPLMNSSSFIYMSGESKRKVLAVNLLADPTMENQTSPHSLCFEKRRRLPQHLGQVLELSGRWVKKVTQADARDLASAMAWVLPGELPETPRGALAFRLLDDQMIMFPIVAQS